MHIGPNRDQNRDWEQMGCMKRYGSFRITPVPRQVPTPIVPPCSGPASFPRKNWSKKVIFWRLIIVRVVLIPDSILNKRLFTLSEIGSESEKFLWYCRLLFVVWFFGSRSHCRLVWIGPKLLRLNGIYDLLVNTNSVITDLLERVPRHCVHESSEDIHGLAHGGWFSLPRGPPGLPAQLLQHRRRRFRWNLVRFRFDRNFFHFDFLHLQCIRIRDI